MLISVGDIVYQTDMRTLVDIPNVHIQALAELCEQVNKPRAAVVREAIGEYLAKHKPDTLTDAFGLWRDMPEDGLAYQEKVRAEW
mgnify:CR=1 FL=1